MTCREFIEFLMDYVSGDLPEGQRLVFDEHLKICPSCVAYMNTYLQTVKLGKESFSEDPTPEDAPQELIQAILEARKNRTPNNA